ncbi:MAG: hypothetical protein Q7J48_21805, partial [Nocardioides sp.]|nr:hypothetical protein [Nocardioides sp.]
MSRLGGRRTGALLLLALGVLLGVTLGPGLAAPASAAPPVHAAVAAQAPDEPGVEGPQGPEGPTGASEDPGSVTVKFDGLTEKPSSSVVLLVALTFLSLLPAILLTCTSFTKILVVLGLTRNALGLQQTPPNQVL